MTAVDRRAAARRRLFRANRLVVAERLGWPAGAVETCEQLERQHPGWDVTWMDAWHVKGWEHPVGWSASRDDLSLPRGDEMRRLPEDGVARHPCVFGATVAELRARIVAMEQRIEARKELEENLWRTMLRG